MNDTRNDMDIFQNNYFERKKPDQKRIYGIIFLLLKL